MSFASRRSFLLQSAAIIGTGLFYSTEKRLNFIGSASAVGPTTSLTDIEALPYCASGTIREIAGGWTFTSVNEAPQFTGEALSSAGAFKMNKATVPGTVLTSMINNGVYPDPLYRQIVTKLIPDNLHKTDYWYRTEIDVPALQDGQRFWLRFSGINYLATIWLNGQEVGRIEGAFKRGNFDVTDIIKNVQGQKTFLAVRIHQLDHVEGPLLPSYSSGRTRGGTNGGPSGQTLNNGPTFFCTAGWDWLPTIPDRCLGIWQPVYSFVTDTTRIVNTQVNVTLADDLASASLEINITLSNKSGVAQNGVLTGTISGIAFSHAVSLPAGSEPKTFKLTKNNVPELALSNPKLWWPNGYGDPYLYELSLTLHIGEIISDRRSLKFGVRKITYSRKRGSGTDLGIAINNVPILIMGGNWGLDEALKRIPRERLFNQVRLHKEANLNLIRNWNGQSTSKDFYDACDEYGILVWQDFFFSGEGGTPKNTDRYLDNVRDVITNFRNHPSILLWCGGNEKKPSPQTIVDGLDKLVTELDPQRECLTSSKEDTSEPYAKPPLGGYASGGPYHWVTPGSHFNNVSSLPFHNEIGSHSIPTLEFVQSMLPEASWECPDDYWADRDSNGNGGGGRITDATANRYGKISNLADFVRKSQLMNYECIKAIYESHAGNFGPITATAPATSTGVIMWMTNPAQPSFVWQMYSHDLEQHSSFFAVQHGCRRVHVLMNANTRKIFVVNHTANPLRGSVEIAIHNLDGTQVSRTVENVPEIKPASSASIVDISSKISTSTSDICFISLRLIVNGNFQSENFYWCKKSGDDDDYKLLDTMKPASLGISAKVVETGKTATKLNVKVENISDAIALMVHLQIFDKVTGARILPAFYSNNYLNILPNKSTEITVEVPHKDGKAVENLAIRIDGWKIDRAGSKLSTVDVPISFNENALNLQPKGAAFASCK